MQDSDGDKAIEHTLVDTAGEGEGGMQWENRTETYALCYVKQIACYMTQGAQSSALRQPRGVGWARRWERGSRGRGHVYTYG